jgi:hypothetical protein
MQYPSLGVAAMANPALEEILDFITSQPSLEAIVNFSHSEPILERVDYLIGLEEGDEMSEEEHEELRQFYRAHEFMEQLKIRAKRRLGIRDELS